MKENEERYEIDIQKIVQEIGVERDVAYKIYAYGRKQRQLLKNSLWQYVIDHTQIQPNGYMGIQLYCKDRNDFLKRIKSRDEGFKRYDIIKKEILAAKVWKRYNKNEFGKKHLLAKNGNIIEKFVLYLYEKIIQSR